MVCDQLNKYTTDEIVSSLNPYSIGIWSATDGKEIYIERTSRLNPYSIGIWSATQFDLVCGRHYIYVLILILLEYGLRLLKSQIIDFQTLKI